MDALVTNFPEILFYVLAVAAVAGGVGVVAFRNPVHSALSLLWTFLVVAALFLVRHAEFVAAVQVMVYAGGIMVLFLFVIMLVNVRRLRPESVFLSNLAPIAILGGVILGLLVAAGVLLGVMAPSAADTSALQTVNGVVEGNTEALAMTLFTRYLVPFEVVSVVLLVAMIGAIIFGRQTPTLEPADDREGA